MSGVGGLPHHLARVRHAHAPRVGHAGLVRAQGGCEALQEPEVGGRSETQRPALFQKGQGPALLWTCLGSYRVG